MSDPVLTNIERAVIALARNDPPSSLAQRRSLFRQIFGGDIHQELASPRLEALRRYAILRRVHGTTLPEAERRLLRESGFGDLQTSEIDRLIVAESRLERFAKGQPPRRAAEVCSAATRCMLPVNS